MQKNKGNIFDVITPVNVINHFIIIDDHLQVVFYFALDREWNIFTRVR